MDNYIFMTSYYLPKPGATGMCVHQVAKELAKTDNVFTICYRDIGEDKKFEVDGIKVIKIEIPDYLKNIDIGNKRLEKIRYFQSILKKLFYIYKYPLRSNSLVDNYCSVVSQIIKKVGKATIIASYTPLEAVFAAYKLKKIYKGKIKIVYYSTDTLSNEQGNNGLLPVSFREKCGMRWEKKLFSLYDKIFIMECHKNYYFSKKYDMFRKKMEVVNFPLLSKFDKIEKEKKAFKKISFVYVGTFYKILRNPEFMCKCLIQFGKEREIKVDILGGGDCNDILKKAVEKSNNSIVFHGMQPHEKAVEFISSADVLLSVGNAESPMAPSKIYEYMSTGKPIIHIYTYDKDPCITPLEKYGNALIIKEGDIESVDKIKIFLRNYKILNYEEIEKIFLTSTPKYTVNILKKINDRENTVIYSE
ncbi:glycosyltransferase [uncultured Fusobacterium sp.]|uniref:glycosyltransferase n=1 Tax=uncultured Fusobacterium sp. TaxID=159267 RepID=UPI0015A5CC8F|nr:glycosyltransferase [uncultured Fusobacterium sp.]